jgi:hypothetical protein
MLRRYEVCLDLFPGFDWSKWMSNQATVQMRLITEGAEHILAQEKGKERLFDAWKLGKRRKGARYAFAIFEGVVREVYEIEAWHRAGTTPYTTRDAAKLKVDRWEFAGRIADESIRSEYVGGSVAASFLRGQQMPTAYVNC